MRIRDAPAHGDNLEVHVDGVEYQRLNARFGENAWQVLRRYLEEGSARAPYRPACCVHAVDLGNGSESAGACSCGELLFAVGDKIQQAFPEETGIPAQQSPKLVQGWTLQPKWIAERTESYRMATHPRFSRKPRARGRTLNNAK
jgi:hypothetical protein